MNFQHQHHLHLTRRQFFGRTSVGIGTAALASLLNPELFAAPDSKPARVPGVDRKSTRLNSSH